LKRKYIVEGLSWRGMEIDGNKIRVRKKIRDRERQKDRREREIER